MDVRVNVDNNLFVIGRKMEENITSIDIANAVIYYANEEYGGSLSLSGLKLQKIVYYIACEYAKETSKLLFEGRIAKWIHGATIIPLYHTLKNRGMFFKKPLSTKFDINIIPSNIMKHVKNVTDVLITLQSKDIVSVMRLEDAWKSNEKEILGGNKELDYTLGELINATKIKEFMMSLDEILEDVPTKSNITNEVVAKKFKPNPILWVLYSLENSFSGNKSCEFQTDLVNTVCDTVESMDTLEFNERVIFDGFTIRVDEKCGYGFIEIWWENEYYSCGRTYRYGNIGKGIELPHNRYPNMVTRMRLINLRNRLISEEEDAREEKYRQSLKCMNL